MANRIEIGGREREPPPPSNQDSKFKNHAINAALTMNLLSSAGSNSSDLRQFTASNMANQNRETVAFEKSVSNLDKQIHTNEQARGGLIADKKEALSERSDVIKSEYGSVSNYNNSMNVAKLENQRSELVAGKKNISAERNQLIKSEFGGQENYRSMQGYLDSGQRRGELVTQKQSLVSERKELLKSGDNPNRLKKVEAKINRLDGQIRTESANIKAFESKSGINDLKAQCGSRAEFLEKKSQILNKSERLQVLDKKFDRFNKDIDKATAKLKSVSDTANGAALKASNNRGDFLANRAGVAGMQSERLNLANQRVSDIKGQINERSGNIREFSARRENLLAERSNSQQFRAGGRREKLSLTSGCGLERNAAKADGALLKAEKKMPTHRVVRMSYKFDSVDGKINKSLVLEKKIKPVDGGILTKGLKGASTITAARLGQSIHAQISKHENETQNVGLKAAHKAERFAEHGMTKGIQRGHKFIKERPYKKVSKLQHKADKAKAKLYAKRKGGTARQMKKNAKSYMQKAKQSRIAKSPLQKLMEKIIEKIKFLIQALIRKITVLLGKPLTIITAILIVVSIIMGFVIAIAGNSGVFLGAFFAEDSEIHAAQNHANTHAQSAIQTAVNSVVASVPHDSLVLYQYTLNHNPYALISVLSAFAYVQSGNEFDNSFSVNDTNIRNTIERFINTFYVVNYNVVVEIITTVTVDDDGEETVTETTHTTLHVWVANIGEDNAALAVFNSGNPYTPAMYEGYQMYMETFGFRPDLFA